MLSQRHRPIVYALIALVVIWVLAVAGYRVEDKSKMTADMVITYVESLDFASVTGTERSGAITQLETMFKGLSLDERQQVWPEIVSRWFAAMTEPERAQFLAATAAPGFKQKINPLDLLPADQRQQAIADRLKALEAARAQSLAEPGSGAK